MSVSISDSRRVALQKHVVDINVRYGGLQGSTGTWSLCISNWTGRGTPENEVLASLAWLHFDGVATPAQFHNIKRWLKRYELYEFDYGFVAVAVKQLNDGMKSDIARWEKE